MKRQMTVESPGHRPVIAVDWHRFRELRPTSGDWPPREPRRSRTQDPVERPRRASRDREKGTAGAKSLRPAVLLADAQAANHFKIALPIVEPQVLQQARSFGNHHQQPS